jgi:hypothetical protein
MIFPDESPAARYSPDREYARDVTCAREAVRVVLRVTEDPEWV